MNFDQISKIQAYRGDSTEEYWKPQSPSGYVDVFNYWELRQTLRAYLLGSPSVVSLTKATVAIGHFAAFRRGVPA